MIDKGCKHSAGGCISIRVLHVSLMSVIGSLENDQCEQKLKFDPEEQNMLVEEDTNYFDELQRCYLRITRRNVK